MAQIVCRAPYALAREISVPPTVRLSLPQPGTMVPVSQGFVPPILKGISLHPENPLLFDFIIDTGEGPISNENLREESAKLIKYFMAALTVPEEDLWVNLSPYEGERIIPEGFSLTEMGRDLLAQDYLLKQITSSLMYPEKELGKKFWDRVYAKAAKAYGSTDIPLDTFSKVWIVPESARIFRKDHQVFVVDSHLKVMLEADYLARSQSHKVTKSQGAEGARETENDFLPDVVREVLVPELEKEVNEGKNFALLRQVYHSLILAVWYKRNLKDSLLSKVYVDQNKVLGIDLADPSVKQQIYDRYLAAFKEGVFDYIKEDYDQFSRQLIPRKYFSGGFGDVRDIRITDGDRAGLTESVDGDLVMVRGGLLAAENPEDARGPGDSAMLGGQGIPKEKLKPLDTDFYHEGQRFLVKKGAVGDEARTLKEWFAQGVPHDFSRDKWESDLFKSDNVMITLSTTQGELIGIQLVHEGEAMEKQRVFYIDRIEISRNYRGEGLSRKFLGPVLKWAMDQLPEKFGFQPVVYTRPAEDGKGVPEEFRAEEGRRIRDYWGHMGFQPLPGEVLSATGDEGDIDKLSYWALSQASAEGLIRRTQVDSESERERMINEENMSLYERQYSHELNNFLMGMTGTLDSLFVEEELKNNVVLRNIQNEIRLIVDEHTKMREIFASQQQTRKKMEALQRLQQETAVLDDIRQVVEELPVLDENEGRREERDNFIASLNKAKEHLARGITIQPRPTRFLLNDSISEELDHSAWITPGEVTAWSSLDRRIREVFQDRHKLAQILENLIKNAVEAMGRKGGEIRVRTEMSSSRREINIYVADNGPGISPEILKKVYEPEVSSKAGEGRGFGLTVVRRLVEEMGGRVKVDSRVGEGTTFTITLPVNIPTSETGAPQFQQQRLFGEPGDQAALAREQTKQPVQQLDEQGNPVGGIDLNPAGMDLQVDEQGNDISAEFDPARLQNMQVNGFVPVIFSITPVTSLPLLLGEAQPPETPPSLPDSARRSLDPVLDPRQLASLN